MNLLEVTKYLIDNKYLVEFGGKLYVTTKYNVALEEAKNAPQESLVPVVVSNTELAKVEVKENTKDRFKRFVREAEVPYRIEDSNGRSYTANAHSAAAERILNKALNEGYNWQALVFSTKLYYKSNGYKLKISNYFVQGVWESEYDEALRQASEGNLGGYVNGRTNNNGSNMRIR